MYDEKEKVHRQGLTLLRFLGEYSSRDGFLRLSLSIIRAAANAMFGSEQYFPLIQFTELGITRDDADVNHDPRIYVPAFINYTFICCCWLPSQHTKRSYSRG